MRQSITYPWVRDLDVLGSLRRWVEDTSVLSRQTTCFTCSAVAETASFDKPAR